MASIKRIYALDLLKAFAIFLVVMGHVIQHCLSSDHYDEPVYKFIYTFHMPLFMVLCGLFSWNSMGLSFGDLLKKKFLSIILPCISWGIVIYSILLVVHTMKRKAEYDICEFLYLLWNDYWFLKAVFLCYVFAWISVHIKMPNWLSMLFMCLISQTIPLFNISIMFPCFVLGMCLKEFIDKDWFVKLKPVYIFIYICLLLIYKKEYFDGTIESSYLDSSICTLHYWQILLLHVYQFVLGASATMFIISFTRDYFWNVELGKSRYIDHTLLCGKNTLGIYLIHTLLVTYLMQNILKFDNVNFWVFNILIAPIVTFFIVEICLFVINIIKRNKMLSRYLLGANYLPR